jgi:hypothetical protein
MDNNYIGGSEDTSTMDGNTLANRPNPENVGNVGEEGTTVNSQTLDETTEIIKNTCKQILESYGDTSPANWPTGDEVSIKAAKTVMSIAIPMVQELIINNQLIINKQVDEFNSATQPPEPSSTDGSPPSLPDLNNASQTFFIKQQLEARSKLINLVSQVNFKICILLIHCFQIIGSTAFGIAEKTFPVAVIIRLTQMVSNMVNIGNTFAHEISQELNSVTNLPRMPTDYQQEGDSASHDINSLIDTAEVVPAAITATTAAETIAQPTIAGGKIPTKNHKKKIHSLKKKHLFNQKTLKIRNRLHKLLIS